MLFIWPVAQTVGANLCQRHNLYRKVIENLDHEAYLNTTAIIIWEKTVVTCIYCYQTCVLYCYLFYNHCCACGFLPLESQEKVDQDLDYLTRGDEHACALNLHKNNGCLQREQMATIVYSIDRAKRDWQHNRPRITIRVTRGCLLQHRKTASSKAQAGNGWGDNWLSYCQYNYPATEFRHAWGYMWSRHYLVRQS